MSHVFLLISLCVVVLSSVFVLQQLKINSQSVKGVNTEAIQKIEVATPQILDIPSAKVHATIESVGLDAKKRMDVPKQNEHVGWYSLGPKPGAIGNAVLDGHLDTATGAPAVFYYLEDINIGDTITVTDQKGQVFHFVVTNKQSYPWDNFPLDDIFGPSNTAHLHLITCQGIWNETSHNYSQRLVVSADLRL
jgi:sortase A